MLRVRIPVSFQKHSISQQISQTVHKYFNIRLILSSVIVHGKPGKPGGVSASNLDSQSGKVIWTDGTIYGKEISSYRIDGRTNHNSTWVTLADRVRYNINIRG